MKKVVFIAGTIIALLGCNSNQKEKPERITIQSKNKTEASSNDLVSNTIILSSNDQMQFDKKILRVKKGEKITLTLQHAGTMSKNVMGHNFVLLQQGTDIIQFARKAMKAKDTEYIPEGDDVIAYTKLIGGGEKVTITFDAPAPGTYDYICSFPAHYTLMKGKLIVE
ncbi:azurin [Aquimarina sp. TRL1]|uniref:azurin n=1 Tax=Aquimarina sp. (strain TRL1) TaxID=2736252 RepID=UPI001589E159|nr:azurin [Aquimarina sp. TRL1]QKX03682.1 azurin [Aquimarina sp. TRL1]